VFLVFLLVPVTQCLTEILLMQPLHLAAFIPYAVIAGDLCIAVPPDGPQDDVHNRHVDGRGQLCGEGLVGGQMTVSASSNFRIWLEGASP
jgi:hypothetical protein